MENNTINTSLLNNNNSISSTFNSNARVQIVDQSEVGQLDQNAFLNMLLTQLQNQDPLNPLDNTDFAAQLAQYSTLEQLTSIGGKLDNITQLIVAQMSNNSTGNTNNNSNTTNTNNNSNTTNTNNNSDISEDADKNGEDNSTITFTTDFLYSDDKKYTSKINSLINENFNKKLFNN